MMMRRREAPAVNGRELQYFKYDMNYTIWLDESDGLTSTTSMPVVYIHSFRGNGEDVGPLRQYGRGRLHTRARQQHI